MKTLKIGVQKWSQNSRTCMLSFNSEGILFNTAIRLYRNKNMEDKLPSSQDDTLPDEDLIDINLKSTGIVRYRRTAFAYYALAGLADIKSLLQICRSDRLLITELPRYRLLQWCDHSAGSTSCLDWLSERMHQSKHKQNGVLLTINCHVSYRLITCPIIW